MRTLFITIAGILALASACHVLTTSAVAGGKDKKPTAKASAAEIERLVEDLGSSHGPTREMATKTLLKIGEPALPFLEKTRGSFLEVRRRAEALHLQIFDEARFSRAWGYGMDTLVERMLQRRRKLTDADWRLLMKLEDKLRKEGKRKGGKGEPEFIPYRRGNAPAYLDLRVTIADEIKRIPNNISKNIDLRVSLTSKRVLCDRVDGFSIGGSMVLCSGRMEISGLDEAVVLSNGPISGFNKRHQVSTASVVVCDGDVYCSECVNNIIISSGTLILEKPPTIYNTVVIDKNTNPDDPLRRFFAPGLVGLNAKYGNGVARVISVAENSPFFLSGLRRDDHIMAMDHRKFGSQIAFRKLLREKVAAGATVLDVRRGQETRQLRVSFPW